jgi:enediyne biosynthesis protein E5
MSTITKPLPKGDGAVADRQDGHRDGKPEPPAAKPPVDPRIKALWRFASSITIYTTIGVFFLDFEIPIIQPLVAVLTAYVVELGLETLEAWAVQRPARYRGGGKPLLHHLLPAHITGLSVSLMLYPIGRLEFIVFAVAAAVASKFIFTIHIKGRKRHFLNPSNFGVTVAIIAFPSIIVGAPNQYLQSVSHTVVAWILPIFIIFMGTMINGKLTKKMPLILGWLGGFVAQALFRGAFFDHNVLAALLPMTGLIFWVFTNYMITDPGTSPTKPRNQVIFGAAIGLIYGALVLAHIVFGIFIALMIVCIMRGLIIAGPGWWAGLRQRIRPSSVSPPEPARERVAS